MSLINKFYWRFIVSEQKVKKMTRKMTRKDFKKMDLITFQKLMRKHMKSNLSSKTNWGRNQVMEVLEMSLSDVAIDYLTSDN